MTHLHEGPPQPTRKAKPHWSNISARLLVCDTSYRDAVKFLIFEPEALAKKVLSISNIPIFRTDEYFSFNRNTVWFRS